MLCSLPYELLDLVCNIGENFKYGKGGGGIKSKQTGIYIFFRKTNNQNK